MGWRAPECIDMGVESFEESSATMGDPSGFFVRVSKRLDIFSAGLVYYYVLSFGKHPFGDKFSRENNIIKVFGICQLTCAHRATTGWIK